MSSGETRRISVAGVCLLALVAFGAFAAASASAALPEVGRCAAVEKVQEGKKSAYHGGYLNAKCTRVSATKRGRFEWEAGAGANKTFTAELSKPVLDVVSGGKVECSVGELEGGEITGAKTEKFSGATFRNCVNFSERLCSTSMLQLGNIEDPSTIEGELGVITGGASPTVGWDLKGIRFLFSCAQELKVGEIGETLLVEGSVIGAVSRKHEGDLNRMTDTTQIYFAQAGGTQSPESFEGASSDTLTTTTIHGGSSGAAEATGLSASELNRFGEPLEVKAEE